VKRPLEAPYQGPYPVIKRSDDAYVVEIRSKPCSVSIDRLKPAVLPSAHPARSPDVPPASTTDASTTQTDRTHQNMPAHREKEETKTRTGRMVRFKADPNFDYS